MYTYLYISTLYIYTCMYSESIFTQDLPASEIMMTPVYVSPHSFGLKGFCTYTPFGVCVCVCVSVCVSVCVCVWQKGRLFRDHAGLQGEFLDREASENPGLDTCIQITLMQAVSDILVARDGSNPAFSLWSSIIEIYRG